MKSQILKAIHLVSGDKVKLNWEVETNSDCICFVAVVSKDDELFPEFLKRCE